MCFNGKSVSLCVLLVLRSHHPVFFLCRHIVTELIETERLYVEELQSIIEVQYVCWLTPPLGLLRHQASAVAVKYVFHQVMRNVRS